MKKRFIIKLKQLFFLCFLAFQLILGGLLPSASFAQDIHFSQIYMSPLTLNPALAGAVFEKQALINYKDQWSSITTPYKTLAASYDMRFNKKKEKKGFWAGGINFFSDKAGDNKLATLQANITAAYHVRLNEYSTLGAGVQGGFGQKSLSDGASQWGNQYDGYAYNSALPTGEIPNKTFFTYPDLSAGIVWNYYNTSGSIQVSDNHDLKANAGLSVFHVTQPKDSYYNNVEKLFMKYVFHASALVSIPNSRIALVPSFMYCIQGPSKELIVGSLIRYKIKQDSKYTGSNKGSAISIGALSRAKDAMTVSMLLEFSNYALGMSYDLTTSKLISASKGRGGVELTLRFVFPNPFVNKK